MDNMIEVIEQIKMEFSRNSELTLDGISLYEQKNGSWYLREELISFEDNQDTFLQLQERSI